MAEKNEKSLWHPRGLFMQWMGVLAGPVAWGLQMQTNYALVPWVCKNGGQILLHVVTLLALVVTILGAFAAWRGWQEGAAEEAEGDGGGRISRARFMGALGLMVSAMFLLVIIAQAIPSFMFHPCQR